MLNNNALRQLDLQDVVVFLYLYQYKSARRTAELLSISQPTVSYCLKRLRSCFHDVLFDVDHGSLVATPKADTIEPYLRTVIDAVCAEIQDGLLPAPTRPVIRVCAPEYFELMMLPDTLEIFMKQGSQASLIVERLGRELPIERLLAGEIDLAVGFGPGYHRLHPSLEWESILSDTFVCLSASRRLPTMERVTLDEFCDMQHVFPTPWISERNMIDGWLEQLGRTRCIVARANTYQACLNIVAKLPVMLTLPRRLTSYLSIPSEVEIYEAPFGFPTFTLDVVWATQSERNSEVRKMRTLLNDIARTKLVAIENVSHS